MRSNHLILCHRLLLLSSIFPSLKVFANESALHIRWPKYWSSRFSNRPSNIYSGLISFGIYWLVWPPCHPRVFSVLHYLLESAQTQVHWVNDAIQTPHPVLPSSPPALIFPSVWACSSQLFTSGGQSIGASTSASVLPMNIQGWFPWGFTGLSPCCPSNSQESSPAPQFDRISS